LRRPINTPARGSLSGLSGVIRARIAHIDKEMEEIENNVREGKLSFKEAVERYLKLKRARDALEDLLASIGG
jgi:hypothetical protein